MTAPPQRFALPGPRFVMLPLDEYEVLEAFEAQVNQIQDAIARGRLEGKIDGYRAILAHIKAGGAGALGYHIDNRDALTGRLERLIKTCEEDLARLAPIATPAAEAPVQGPLTLAELGHGD